MVDFLNVTMGHMGGVVTLGGEISLFRHQDGHCNNTMGIAENHAEVSMSWGLRNIPRGCPKASQ